MKDQVDTSQLCAIEELIRQRRFEDALSEISAIFQSPLASGEYESYTLLEAEAKLYTGKYNLVSCV